MLWCFSLYNDVNKRGSVFGSSLSHAISKFDDLKTWCLAYSVIHPAFVVYLFWGQKRFFFATVAFTVLCILISTFSYIKIYQTVRQHQLQIQAQQKAVQSLNAEHNLNIAQSIEKAFNAFMYYISMILCYSPVFITSITQAILSKISPWAWTLASTVTFMNSSTNPFLYCWRTRELWTTVLKTPRIVLFKQ